MPTTKRRKSTGPSWTISAVHRRVDGAFAIGAYGSGAVLAKLLAERLITFPWISMSRLFLGTEQFFYSNRWWMRQVPPELTHGLRDGV